MKTKYYVEWRPPKCMRWVLLKTFELKDAALEYIRQRSAGEYRIDEVFVIE